MRAICDEEMREVQAMAFRVPRAKSNHRAIGYPDRHPVTKYQGLLRASFTDVRGWDRARTPRRQELVSELISFPLTSQNRSFR